MQKKKNITSIIITGVVLLISIVLLLYVFSNSGKANQLDLTKTSKNQESKDEMIGFLYDRYQVEDGNKFSIVGSDIYSDINDYYGLYYRKKVKFDDFPDIYKSYILLDLMNYKDHEYDSNRNCYFYSLDEFKDAYSKYYGSLDHFSIDTSDKYLPRFYLDKDKLCISSEMDQMNYTKVIDTYFVNGIYKDNEIIIYERVAFIKVNGNSIDFYQDYSMKNKVYSLEKGKADLSFIHNSKIVSNVLMEYKDKFSIYEYHYRKGEGTYYLDSIHS